MPIITAEQAFACVTFMPFGRQSGLSRRSTSIAPAVASTATVTLIVTPSGGVPGNGSCVLVRVTMPLGSRAIAAIILRSE